jgi:hypothetical protein
MYALHDMALSQGSYFCQVKYWKNTAHSLVTMAEDNNNMNLFACFLNRCSSGYLGKHGNHGNKDNDCIHGNCCNHEYNVTIVSKVTVVTMS